MSGICKVVIIDKYPLFSSGIKSILFKNGQFHIVGEVESHRKLKGVLFKESVDVIIYDIVHSKYAGLKSLKVIQRKYPKIPVLLIVSQDLSNYYTEYCQLGAKGFVSIESGEAALIEAIQALHRGNVYFPDQFKKTYRKVISGKIDKPSLENSHPLTARETSILRLFCQGLTYKEIGVRLFISPRTVETHKNNIQSKLRVNSTAEMIRYAYVNQLIV